MSPSAIFGTQLVLAYVPWLLFFGAACDSLDGTVARLGHVETAANDVDQRLTRAMNVIGAVIERVQAQQPAGVETEETE